MNYNIYIYIYKIMNEKYKLDVFNESCAYCTETKSKITIQTKNPSYTTNVIKQVTQDIYHEHLLNLGDIRCTGRSSYQL